jgi:hypothetical protein
MKIIVTIAFAGRCRNAELLVPEKETPERIASRHLSKMCSIKPASIAWGKADRYGRIFASFADANLNKILSAYFTSSEAGNA